MQTLQNTSNAEALGRVLFREHVESSCLIDDVEGHIPDYVRGSWYLNGPAKFQRNGQRYRNWLDGDGMVCALHFGDAAIRFTSRYVKTQKFTDEEAAGRFLYRAFGTAFPDDRLKRGFTTESPGNVSVVFFDGRLLAFGEQSIPIELDPYTLETQGLYRFDGAVNEVTPFSAHPKIDPLSGELLNFGISFSATSPRLYFYRFDAHGKRLLRASVNLPAPCSLHDFAVSRKYVSFYLSPYLLDVERLMREDVSTVDALSWDPTQPAFLLILDRGTGEQVALIEMPAAYSLHTINSFESDDRLIVDLLELDEPVYASYQPLPCLFEHAPVGKPVRLEIDLAAQRIDRTEVSFEATIDFPCIDSRLEQTYSDNVWYLAIRRTTDEDSEFFNQLVHTRMSRPNAAAEIYTASPGTWLAGEPLFVANPDRDTDGVIICQEYSQATDSGAIVLFDARDIRRGPIARLALQTPMHFGFHTTFVPAGA